MFAYKRTEGAEAGSNKCEEFLWKSCLFTRTFLCFSGVLRRDLAEYVSKKAKNVPMCNILELKTNKRTNKAKWTRSVSIWFFSGSKC